MMGRFKCPSAPTRLRNWSWGYKFTVNTKIINLGLIYCDFSLTIRGFLLFSGPQIAETTKSKSANNKGRLKLVQILLKLNLSGKKRFCKVDK